MSKQWKKEENGRKCFGAIERKYYLNQEDYGKLERKTKERSSRGNWEVVEIVVEKISDGIKLVEEEEDIN